MSSNPITPTTDLNQPTRWAGVAAGLFIFVVATYFLAMSELSSNQMSQWKMWAFWGILLVPAAGFGLGWILGFPRWSYPYAALAGIIALYIANSSTPGLTFFGYPTFGREIWGIRSLTPLLIAGAIAWIVTRSFHPIGKFFAQIYADWSLLAYAMFGVLPLVVYVAFDEIDNTYSLRSYLLLCSMMFAVAILYLRSRNPRQRNLALIGGTIAIVAATAISVSLYWYRLGPQNVYIPGVLITSICVSLFILWPFVIVGMARVMDRSVHSGAA